MEKGKQFRNICFTLNNFTDEEYKHLKDLKTSYIVIGKEIAESGTPHLQGYMEFNGGVRFETLKKQFPRIHLEARRGTSKQASDYCKKSDPNFYENGIISNQGARQDLETIKNRLFERETTVRELRSERPDFYHMYGRTMEKLEEDLMELSYRTQQTEGIWLWGPTGCGKSVTAFIDFHPDTHYVWKLNDNGWQDGYRQQPIVVIDDFRGTLAYDELLRMVDTHPNYTVPRRGRAPMPFTSKLVIITSSLPPVEVYHRRNERDSIEQLNRRFQTFELPLHSKSATEVVRVILHLTSSCVAKKSD